MTFQQCPTSRGIAGRISLVISILSASVLSAAEMVPNSEGGMDFSASWATEAGALYQIQNSSSPELTWTEHGEPFKGNGATLRFSEVASASKQFYRLNKLEGPPRILRVATAGDSITADSSSLVYNSTGTNYWPCCWPAHLRTVVDHRIQYVQNPLTGRYTFAVSGALTPAFLAGGTLRDRWEAALESDADTIIMMLGVNDIVHSDINAEFTVANVTTLLDEAIAAGKQVVGLEILGVRADHPSAESARVKQVAVNAALRQAAIERHLLFIGCGDLLDEDGDGFSDPKYLRDNVHPGILGGMRVADFVATKMQSRLDATPVVTIPEIASPSWVTHNSHPGGNLGPGEKANGWTIQTAGNAQVASALLERADGVPGCWQRLEISGTRDEATLRSSPSDFIQVYTSNFSASFSEGDRLVAVAEVELETPFWSVWLEMHVGGYRAGDHHHNGALAFLTEKPGAYRGILVTEPWTYQSGSSAIALLKICGNGSIKIGRLGVYRVEG